MLINNLHEQIKKVIEHFCNGSLTSFAASLEAPQSTLQRNVAAGDTGKLLRFVPQILKCYPTVSEAWLYTGEGPMLTIERPLGIPETVKVKDHLPNIASEHMQNAFVTVCKELGVTPRQALLLAHIWVERSEHEACQMSDAMLNILEFSPDVLPCGGHCTRHKVSVTPVEK